MWNEMSEHLRLRESHCHSAPPREPRRIIAQPLTLYFLETTFIRLHFRRLLCASIIIRFFVGWALKVECSKQLACGTKTVFDMK